MCMRVCTVCVSAYVLVIVCVGVHVFLCVSVYGGGGYSVFVSACVQVGVVCVGYGDGVGWNLYL